MGVLCQPNAEPLKLPNGAFFERRGDALDVADNKSVAGARFR
jgi:hypothetical protein